MKNWLKNLHPLKKLAIFVIGMTVLLIGFIMLFTPGPGTLTMVLGIVILAAGFLWARRLLKRIKGQSKKISPSLYLKTKKVWHNLKVKYPKLLKFK